MYILFRNNTGYVSNFICDDDYTRVYPRFLYEQDTGRETWRGSYFTGKEVVSLRSDVNVYSHYATPQRYQALVCTVDVYPHTFANQRSVLVCNFNFEEFVSGVVSPDILDSCVLYLKENGGQTVASYHAAGEDLSAGISSQEYEIISSSPSELGYQLVLGVPKSYLNRRAGASFFIIPVYFFIGLAAIFLLFSVKETNAMGTVIRTASALFPTSEPSDGPRNEYAYISGILKTSATELEDINRLLKTSALENLFLNSSPINSDRNYIRLFQSAFDFYCVAVIRLTDHRDEELHRLYFYFLADSCRGILQETFFPGPHQRGRAFPADPPGQRAQLRPFRHPGGAVPGAGPLPGAPGRHGHSPHRPEHHCLGPRPYPGDLPPGPGRHSHVRQHQLQRAVRLQQPPGRSPCGRPWTFPFSPSATTGFSTATSRWWRASSPTSTG